MIYVLHAHWLMGKSEECSPATLASYIYIQLMATLSFQIRDYHRPRRDPTYGTSDDTLSPVFTFAAPVSAAQYFKFAAYRTSLGAFATTPHRRLSFPHCRLLPRHPHRRPLYHMKFAPIPFSIATVCLPRCSIESHAAL